MPRLFTTLTVLALVCWGSAYGQGSGEYPTYQRNRQAPSYGGGGHASGGSGHHGQPQQPNWGYQRDRHRGHSSGQHNAPQVSGSYFQRPYPFHLDYYRMRWGGSYAPYFGNLYGPPNVVLGVPPFYFGGGYVGQGNWGQGNWGQSNWGQGNWGQGVWGQGGFGQGYYGGATVVPYEAAPTPAE